MRSVAPGLPQGTTLRNHIVLRVLVHALPVRWSLQRATRGEARVPLTRWTWTHACGLCTRPRGSGRSSTCGGDLFPRTRPQLHSVRRWGSHVRRSPVPSARLLRSAAPNKHHRDLHQRRDRFLGCSACAVGCRRGGSWAPRTPRTPGFAACPCGSDTSPCSCQSSKGSVLRSALCGSRRRCRCGTHWPGSTGRALLLLLSGTATFL